MSKLNRCHGQHHKPSFNEALNSLKNAGLKLTRPRLALLKTISQLDRPFSAEELFTLTQRALKNQKSVRCDLVTVYRSLASFAEIKLVERIELGDGVVRYEFSSLDGSHHHHIVCLQCRKIEAVSDCAIQGQEKVISKMGYAQVSHRLEFFGVCQLCQEATP